MFDYTIQIFPFFFLLSENYESQQSMRRIQVFLSVHKSLAFLPTEATNPTKEGTRGAHTWFKTQNESNEAGKH